MAISVLLGQNAQVQINMTSSDAEGLIGELGKLVGAEFSSTQLLSLLESLLAAKVQSTVQPAVEVKVNP